MGLTDDMGPTKGMWTFLAICAVVGMGFIRIQEYQARGRLEQKFIATRKAETQKRYVHPLKVKSFRNLESENLDLPSKSYFEIDGEYYVLGRDSLRKPLMIPYDLNGSENLVRLDSLSNKF